MRRHVSLVIGFASLVGLAGCGETFQSTTGAGGGGAGAAGGGTSSQGGAAGTGGKGGPTSTGAAGTTGGTSGDTCKKDESNVCNTCLYDSCQEAYCGCVGNSDCEELLICYFKSPKQPPEWAYLEYCWQQHKDAISLAGNLLACAGNKCLCPLPPVDACTICEFQHCSTQINNCLGTAACSSYVKCYSDCGADALCQTNCGINNSDGLQKAQEVGMCANASCSSACGK